MISWGISSPFELLSLSSGQVTNALLTRSPLRASTEVSLSVRLACIRHAASVHPEPGSNSPLIYFFFTSFNVFIFLLSNLRGLLITLQLLRCFFISIETKYRCHFPGIGSLTIFILRKVLGANPPSLLSTICLAAKLSFAFIQSAKPIIRTYRKLSRLKPIF